MLGKILPATLVVLLAWGECATVRAQIVPDTQRIAWNPGVPGGIPDISVACPASAPSVRDFGAVGDGVADDYPAFAAAIDDANEGSAIRVPEGTYLLRTGLSIGKGIVLCGEGPERSQLVFDCAQNAISIVTYDRGDWIPVAGGTQKDSTELNLSDVSGFAPGDFAELQQDNDWNLMDPENYWRNPGDVDWVPEDCMGQMFEVIAVGGNTLSVDPPLHIAFDPAMNPVIRRMGLVTGAGLQGLGLTLPNSADRSTVEIKNAAFCWIRDCLSDTTMKSHVSVSSSFRCEVRHNTFHDSHDYGGGGHGYGTNLGTHTTGCLIEDNVFVHLRHSMLVQVGATGNVFGYNYSIEPDSGESWTPCDISLHGHYPNMNLFEGNTVQEVDVSDYWGPCGPGNTFLRNRVESEGIQVMDYSHRQNVVGNELTTDPNIINIEGNVQDTLVHGNHQDGAITWDPGIDDHELPVSYYHASKPDFFGCTPWPATGGDLAPDGWLIPAEQRHRGQLVECDGGIDADAGVDAGLDAGIDAGVDAGTDAEADSGPDVPLEKVSGGCGCGNGSPGTVLLVLALPAWMGLRKKRPRP